MLLFGESEFGCPAGLFLMLELLIARVNTLANSFPSFPELPSCHSVAGNVAGNCQSRALQRFGFVQSTADI